MTTLEIIVSQGYRVLELENDGRRVALRSYKDSEVLDSRMFATALADVLDCEWVERKEV